MRRTNIILFGTALSQVMLVSMNVVFISKGTVWAMLTTGFLISLVWTFNVSKVAFSNWRTRLIYAAGAACGTILGYYITTLIK